MRRNPTKAKTLILTALTAFLALGSLATAAEQTRESYVAAVEPISKTNTQANEKILKGVRQEVKAGKLAPAGAAFLKAAKALKQTYAPLAAVPQPAADAAKLTKWLSYVKAEG
jgi:molybdenum-dependent DNA-binding transcriptional regulator ModE